MLDFDSKQKECLNRKNPKFLSRMSMHSLFAMETKYQVITSIICVHTFILIFSELSGI